MWAELKHVIGTLPNDNSWQGHNMGNEDYVHYQVTLRILKGSKWRFQVI